MIHLKLTGVKEIDAALKGMQRQLTDKVLQDAHIASLKPTIQKAKLTAPEGPTGNLVDSIGSVRARGKGTRELGLVYGGPRRGRGRGMRGQAGHLVEYGTRTRKTKAGAGRGAMTAKPFMEPAWEQTKDVVVASIAENIGRKLWLFMKRTIR